MPGKTVSHAASTPKTKAAPYIYEFFQHCNSHLSVQEWNIAPFLKLSNDMSLSVFEAFLKFFKDYGTSFEDYKVDYSYILEQLEEVKISELENAKTQSSLNNNDERIKELNASIEAGLYRVRLWFVILEQVLPNKNLLPINRVKFEREIMDAMFVHLPGLCEAFIKSFLALEDGADAYDTIQEQLILLKTYAPIYIAQTSPEDLAHGSVRLLGALAKAHEFSLIMEEAPKAKLFNKLFNVAYTKIEAIISTAKQAELKKQLEAIKKGHNQTKENLKANPWAALFSFYQNDWINSTLPEAKTIGDIQAEGSALVNLLQDDSLEAQTKFIERLKKVLIQFNFAIEDEVTPEKIEQYSSLMQSIYDTCLERNLPKDESIRGGVYAILLSMLNNIKAETPIVHAINSCLDLIKGLPLPPGRIDSLPKFEENCSAVVAGYELYACYHPQNWNTSEHLLLVKRLQDITIDFKSLPGEFLIDSTKKLYGTLLSIMKLCPGDQYQPLADELKNLMFSLIKLKSQKSNPVPPPVTHSMLESAPEPIVEMPVRSELSREKTPELDRDPTPIPLREQTPEIDRDLTPVLERQQTPELERDSTPVPEQTPEFFEIPLAAINVTADLQPEKPSKAEVDKQVQSLAKELKEMRISKGSEHKEANDVVLEAKVNELEQKLRGLQIKHEKKLAAQQKRNDEALEKEKQILDAQNKKKLAAAAKHYAKALKKQEKSFKAQKQALSDSMEGELQKLLQQKARENQERLKEQREKYVADLKAERESIESSPEAKEMDLQFQAQLKELEKSYESAKKGLPERIKGLKSKAYQQAYDAKRAEYVEKLKDFRIQSEIYIKKQFESDIFALEQGEQVAKHDVFAQELRKYVNEDNVVLPKPLLGLLSKLQANPTNPLSVSNYYKTIRKLFVHPEYIRHFNLIINYGFLPSLFPTLPERCSLILSKYPALLAFWRNELTALNVEPKHDAHIMAMFLLLPILVGPKSGNHTLHVQDCIGRFVACFNHDEPEDIVALTKSVETILLDKEDSSLYNRYCDFELHFNKELEMSRSVEGSPSYLPNFKKEQRNAPLPASEPIVSEKLKRTAKQ